MNTDSFVKSLEQILVGNIQHQQRLEPFESTLLLDLRDGQFAFFVVQQSPSGLPAIEQRPIKVEEPGPLEVALSTGALCAYKSGNRWVACTASRLQQLISDPSRRITRNIFDELRILPATLTIGETERLLHAFLGAFLREGAGREYDRIGILVDRPGDVAIVQRSLALLTGRLPPDQAARWRTASLHSVGTSLQLLPYIASYFASRRNWPSFKALVVRGVNTVDECIFDGIDVSSTRKNMSVDINGYDAVALVGFGKVNERGPFLWSFGSATDFDAACWAGWMHVNLMKPEQRLVRLTNESARVNAALQTVQQRTAQIKTIVQRLVSILAKLSAKQVNNVINRD
jgi:hypothetical protein